MRSEVSAPVYFEKSPTLDDDVGLLTSLPDPDTLTSIFSDILFPRCNQAVLRAERVKDDKEPISVNDHPETVKFPEHCSCMHQKLQSRAVPPEDLLTSGHSRAIPLLISSPVTLQLQFVSRQHNVLV